jgi:hypothetical protein
VIADWWLPKIERALERFARWRCGRRGHRGQWVSSDAAGTYCAGCGSEVTIRWEPSSETIAPWEDGPPH